MLFLKTRPIIRSLLPLITLAILSMLQPARAQSGGFVEPISTAQTRTRLDQSQIQSLLPARGKFSFPAPYNTEAVRVTNSTDCAGSDCVKHIGYSYWRNMNNHVGSDTMYIFLGLDRNRGGGGPTLFSYNKSTDALTKTGPLFSADSPYSMASGEGWYFSASLATKLYINDGAKMLRYDVVSKQFETVFDAGSHFGQNRYIWQMHSSNDDRVHSATLRDSNNYEMLGCMVYREDTSKFSFYPKVAEYDECQVDKSGQWLVIKDNVDGTYGEDNRIINLNTGAERLLMDQDGAGGHSDLGFGTMVAADNWANLSNTQKVWQFNTSTLQGKSVYYNFDWNAAAPAHVSYTNARPDLPLAQQYACGSSANRNNTPHANEIVCFPTDNSSKVLVVAPVMTDMNAVGGGDDYGKSPKGNLDVTGQYFIWTSNTGGNRLDAFVVKVPGHLLGEVVPDPIKVPDTSKPLITNVKVQSITTSSAVITWSSNEPANSRVQYSLRLPLSKGTSTAWTNTHVTNHTVSLSGLIANKDYHYRVRSRDAAGNIGESAIFKFRTTSTSTSQPVSVIWTDRVNATVSATSLQKTSGCDGCADAGAVSQQQLTGDGFLQFTASETTKTRFVGLTTNHTGTSSSSIAFALRFQSGIVEVRESGVYRADTRINSGDEFRIQVKSGKVSYLRNGAVFYTSGIAPVFPLRTDVSLYSINSAIENAVMSAEEIL